MPLKPMRGPLRKRLSPSYVAASRIFLDRSLKALRPGSSDQQVTIVAATGGRYSATAKAWCGVTSRSGLAFAKPEMERFIRDNGLKVNASLVFEELEDGNFVVTFPGTTMVAVPPAFVPAAAVPAAAAIPAAATVAAAAVPAAAALAIPAAGVVAAVTAPAVAFAPAPLPGPCAPGAGFQVAGRPAHRRRKPVVAPLYKPLPVQQMSGGKRKTLDVGDAAPKSITAMAAPGTKRARTAPRWMVTEEFLCEAAAPQAQPQPLSSPAAGDLSHKPRKPRPAKAAAHPTSSGSRGRRPRPAKAAPPAGPASPVTMASLLVLAAAPSPALPPAEASAPAEPSIMLALLADVAVGMEVDVMP